MKKVINDQVLQLDSNLDTKRNYMVDLIIMRQVLEHVKDPKMFLKHSLICLMITELLISKCLIFYTLEKKQGFDLCFEHLQYFSLENLKYLVANVGMDILSWGFTEDKHDMYVVSIKKRKSCGEKQNKIERNVENSNIVFEFPYFRNKWIAYGLNSNLESILNFTDSTIPEFIIDDSVAREGVVHFGDKKIHCSNSGLIKKNYSGFSRTLLRGNSALSLYAD